MRADGLAAVPTNDVRAVTLPGAVAAFERLLLDHGLLGWAEVATRLGLPSAGAARLRYVRALAALQSRWNHT